MHFSGRDHGNHLNLAQIQKLVEDDTEMQDLSEAQQQVFINKLQTYHNIKHTGIHASNTAATVDSWGAVARISNEVSIP